MKKEQRKSNYELLRIVSMLFIVLYHVIFHGQILQNCDNVALLHFFQTILFIIIVHVNSYILVTGYFQSKSNFKQSKVWSIINASLFYKIGIIIILVCLGTIPFSKSQLLLLNDDEYWFIKCYLFLYCLSPFLNKFIEYLDKKEYQKLLIVLFTLFCVIPYFTGNKIFDNNGYSLYHFIFLYFIGAYFRKFSIIEEKILKNPFKKKIQLLLVFCFILCIVINTIMYRLSFSLCDINTITDVMANHFISKAFAYSNPITVIQSIVFFLFFGTLNFKSKMVNAISKLTLEVYLIHDNRLIRQYLYNWLNIQGTKIVSYKFVFYVFLVVLIIYIVCTLIGWLRQNLFRFIYRFSISEKLRTKYYQSLVKIKTKFYNSWNRNASI